MSGRRGLMQAADMNEDLLLNDILTLDGIVNTRNGHNASATVWEDLSGNQHDFAAASGVLPVWGTDHAAFIATDRRMRCTADLQGAGNKLTIELVVQNDGDGSTVINSTSHQGMILTNTTAWSDSSGKFKFYSYRDPSSNGVSSRYGATAIGYIGGLASIKYLAYVFDGTTVIRYTNSSVCGNASMTYQSGTKGQNWVIGGVSDGSQKGGYFYGKVFRIGISAKAMTAEEVAERYAYFVKRFGIS